MGDFSEVKDAYGSLLILFLYSVISAFASACLFLLCLLGISLKALLNFCFVVSCAISQYDVARENFW